jgi:hypothetical protein
MNAWVMGQTIGFDGFRLSASYPNAAYGSETWKWGSIGTGERYANQRQLFHGYERETPNSDVDRDVALILEARHRTTEQAKARWTASAENLALRPGLILKLGHFYGKNDTEGITALVTGATLLHKARWPVDLAAAAEDSGAETTAVEGTCVDWGERAVKRFCPDR